MIFAVCVCVCVCVCTHVYASRVIDEIDYRLNLQFSRIVASLQPVNAGDWEQSLSELPSAFFLDVYSIRETCTNSILRKH